MKKAREIMDRLLEATEDLEDELPESVAEAINELADEVEDAKHTAGRGWRAFFYKNGSFSKTAAFATIGNVLVIGHFLLSWFEGAVVPLGLFEWTIPAFNATGSGVIAGILNGTYWLQSRDKAHNGSGNG